MRSKKNIFRKGRGLGRGGSIVEPCRGVADDGKRLEEARVALGVAFETESFFRSIGGVWGGE